MIIDDDLADTELDIYYKQYESNIISIYPDIIVEQYILENNYSARKILSGYIKECYTNNNLAYIFFVGKNADITVYEHYMDINGTVTNFYNKNGLSFYTNIYNNEYEYSESEDIFLKKLYMNCSNTYPDIQTRLVYGRFPEISFGAIIPTNSDIAESKQQILTYFTKLHGFRSGNFRFEKKIIYSDTLYGNDYLLPDIAAISRWQNNLGLSTTHEPSPDYHATDPEWRELYLDALSNESFELCWLSVHGAPTYHYFGIDYTDIIALPELNTLFISLDSCNNGNYITQNYIAGTYLLHGNVLAVEANMVPTMYIHDGPTVFANNYSFSEISKGKSIGDAIRQNGSTFLTHILFGDPILSLDDYNIINKGDVNGDDNINIIDALIIAQYYVGLIQDINQSAADTNCDGIINIIDALLVSQFYVGLVSGFC